MELAQDHVQWRTLLFPVLNQKDDDMWKVAGTRP